MSAYGGKRTYNNYHYSHNQLSADNPFRFIGTTFDPYQPKASNQQYPLYDTKTAQISKKKQPLSPYERKSFYDNTDNNENRPWSKTSSTSSLINNSYNIINNNPYSKNQNSNYSLISQQRDHVGELFNYTNRDLPNYYSSNKKQNVNSNNTNENLNQPSFNGEITLKNIKTPQKNIFENNVSSTQKVNNIENINNNNRNDYSSNNNNKKDKLFSTPQNYLDLFIRNRNYDNIDDRQNNYNYNKYNKENVNFNSKLNDNISNNIDTNNKSYTKEKISNIQLAEYSEDNCTAIKSYAYKENPNTRFRDYMEDKGRVIENIKDDPNSCLFCLFDGHGGGDVSKFLQLNFYSYFKEMLPFDNVKENLISLFKKIDNKIKDSNYYNMGATACIIYITKENGQKCLYSANIGDTRSLLISSNDYKRLSYDHRASDAIEYKRIIDSGGIVFAGRVYGQLMLSRAFGDWELKPYGVICEPHVTRINITDNDKYVVVASDGIWDIFEDSDIFNMSKKMGNSKEFCNSIVNQAIENGSMDNISCFVIKLN